MGESLCSYCECRVIPAGHKCYMTPEKMSKKKLEEHRDARFLFSDFATFVMDHRELVPNLTVVQHIKGEEHLFPQDNVPL